MQLMKALINTNKIIEILILFYYFFLNFLSKIQKILITSFILHVYEYVLIETLLYVQIMHPFLYTYIWPFDYIQNLFVINCWESSYTFAQSHWMKLTKSQPKRKNILKFWKLSSTCRWVLIILSYLYCKLNTSIFLLIWRYIYQKRWTITMIYTTDEIPYTINLNHQNAQ